MTFESDLSALVAEFIDGLEKAQALYAVDQREGAFAAVTSATHFVAELKSLTGRVGPTRPPIEEPLSRLALALASVMEGVRDPLLEPEGNARKGLLAADEYARAEAAGVMAVLKMSGLKEREAADLVARALEGSRLAASIQRGQAPIAVMNWRKQVLQTGERRTQIPGGTDVSWDRLAATAYNSLIKLGERMLKIEKKPAEQVRRQFLDTLRRHHPRQRRPRS